MKKLFLIILLFPLLSGCDFSGSSSNCDDYCDGNIVRSCENSGGWLGGKDEWYSTDCEKRGQICVEFGKYKFPTCVNHSDICESGMDSYCGEDDTRVTDCYEKNGVFYESPGSSCYSSDYEEKCVEFGNEGICVIQVEECETDYEKVCLDNRRVECHEKDGEFFVEDSYNSECYSYEECVEVDNNALCLEPVDFCIPSTDLHCIGNKQGRCWEKNGRYFASFHKNCDWYDEVCVELDGEEVKCLKPISNCDIMSQSFCVNNSIAECYEANGMYYYDWKRNCSENQEDKCIYDPETKSAHCLSDE